MQVVYDGLGARHILATCPCIRTGTQRRPSPRVAACSASSPSVHAFGQAPRDSQTSPAARTHRFPAHIYYRVCMATFAAIAAISTMARRRRYADMVSTTPRRWLHFWRKARRKKPRAAKRIRMALHEVQPRNLTGETLALSVPHKCTRLC